MLLNLPIELQVDIALYLSPSNKLQLALTCKRLKKTIFDLCLYETLTLTCERKTTKKFLSIFRKNPSLGQKVKVLNIQTNLLTDFEYGRIPIIFPNVGIFCDFSPGYLGHRPEKARSGFIQWKDTLEDIGENIIKKNEFIYKILEQNVFSRLNSLYMTELYDPDGNDIDLLSCLKNAPALEHLTIGHHTVTLKLLETVHSICPLLVSFSVDYCQVLVEKTESLPEKITPALRLSHFLLSNSAIFDEQCLFMAYLTRKYTKITKLTFHSMFSANFVPMFFAGSGLLTPTITPMMKMKELRKNRDIYMTSAPEALSNLPSTLRHIQINSFNMQNPMTIFSRQCVNVTRLEFFNYVFNTFDDIKLFSQLPLLKHLAICIDPSMQEFKPAPASTSVTHVKVVIPATPLQSEMNIDWILSMFPSLNNLDITRSGVLLMGSQSDPPKTYPNITKLIIGPSPVDSRLLEYVCMAAPNLKDIHWPIFRIHAGETWDGKVLRKVNIQPNDANVDSLKKHYEIDLTSSHLDCFHLTIHPCTTNRDQYKGILLQLKNEDGKVKEFMVTGDELSDNAKDTPRKRINKRITLEYGHTRSIKINSRIAINLEESPIQWYHYK